MVVANGRVVVIRRVSSLWGGVVGVVHLANVSSDQRGALVSNRRSPIRLKKTVTRAPDHVAIFAGPGGVELAARGDSFGGLVTGEARIDHRPVVIRSLIGDVWRRQCVLGWEGIEMGEGRTLLVSGTDCPIDTLDCDAALLDSLCRSQYHEKARSTGRIRRGLTMFVPCVLGQDRGNATIVGSPGRSPSH